MGTQQMLLVVLGIIVVGIAVVIALTVLGTNADQAAKDAVTQDCMKLVSAAQAYFRKPRLLGGGGNSFDGIAIRHCGMQENTDGAGENLTGTFTITEADGPRLEVQGVSASNATQVVLVSLDMEEPDVESRLSVSYSGW